MNCLNTCPPPLKKGGMYYQANWRVLDCDFTEEENRVANKYGLPTYMKYDMEYKDRYFYLNHE